MKTDQVDEILAQWRRERPDVDTSAMGIIGRIGRLERMIGAKLDRVFAEHGLERWEFDVLATLRRSGSPYQLTPGQLLSSMMITSGAVTNRLDRLEERGLVRRDSDPSDGRVVFATLTKTGLAKIDAALPDHAANETKIVASLGASDQADLADLLRQLHHGVAATKAQSGAG